jgi:hypothetical protein
MIDYGTLEDAALFGLEESFANGGELVNDGWFHEGREIVDDWQGEEIAEALYCKYSGLSD